ncbi:MAG: hypothetical protein L6R41_003722 [Letrouitia leprolyta]|nr:MAG: hypothetical protein L6R41_003722 [Letrouitia leprolyta]
MSTPPSSSSTTITFPSSPPTTYFTITPARTPADLSAAALLFKTYASSLPIDISYQSFAQELASLPGAYARENGGEILLARSCANSSTSSSGLPNGNHTPANQPSSTLPNGINSSEPANNTPPSTNPPSETETETEPTTVLGCVALRRLPPSPAPTTNPSSSSSSVNQLPTCEMKRLYITPSARGTGLGFSLAMAIISIAREHGYKVMKLDTLSNMTAAKALYTKLGFVETEAYNETPVKETMFFEKVL